MNRPKELKNNFIPDPSAGDCPWCAHRNEVITEMGGNDGCFGCTKFWAHTEDMDERKESG